MAVNNRQGRQNIFDNYIDNYMCCYNGKKVLEYIRQEGQEVI